MVICAGKIEQFSFATPVGIGLTEVAINLTKLCIKNKPDSILFVGTAGSYGEVGLMEIVESSSASNVEQAFIRGDAYTPIEAFISSEENVSHETIVNSSNYICTNESISKLYLEKNIKLENMEFYSVLKVASKFNIPAKGVFIVTNYCDKDAHKTFIKNHKEAMEKMSIYMQG